MPWTTDAISALVRPDRVHRAVYADAELFDLEMDRIFGRAWLLLGHESQAPTPGDYFTSRMGRERVIVSRGDDGAIHVLYNRCTHRGSTICALDEGRATTFVCPYHGWQFATDGALKSVPVPEGYDETWRRDMARLSLRKVARVALYRGFIFASLSAQGPSLEEFLGPIATSLDDLVDRAPDGAVEVAGGVGRHVYEGNWKFVIENHLDTIHPRFVHASSVSASKAQDDAAHATVAGEIGLRQMRQNGAPAEVWEQIGLLSAPHGHAFMGDYHDDETLLKKSQDPVHREYRARLEARLGAERAQEVLRVSRFNTIVYPNLSFMSQFGQLRIVVPLSVNKTVVNTYVFRLKGAPEEMFRASVAFANIVNGVGSCVLTDDLEVYERMQEGVNTDVEWLDYSRGLGRDRPPLPDGFERGASGTSEIHLRRQMETWLSYLTDESGDAARQPAETRDAA